MLLCCLRKFVDHDSAFDEFDGGICRRQQQRQRWSAQQPNLRAMLAEQKRATLHHTRRMQRTGFNSIKLKFTTPSPQSQASWIDMATNAVADNARGIISREFLLEAATKRQARQERTRTNIPTEDQQHATELRSAILNSRSVSKALALAIATTTTKGCSGRRACAARDDARQRPQGGGEGEFACRCCVCTASRVVTAATAATSNLQQPPTSGRGRVNIARDNNDTANVERLHAGAASHARCAARALSPTSHEDPSRRSERRAAAGQWQYYNGRRRTTPAADSHVAATRRRWRAAAHAAATTATPDLGHAGSCAAAYTAFSANGATAAIATDGAAAAATTIADTAAAAVLQRFRDVAWRRCAGRGSTR